MADTSVMASINTGSIIDGLLIPRIFFFCFIEVFMTIQQEFRKISHLIFLSCGKGL